MQKGLTLIELLITLAILAILSTVGVPAFTFAIVRYQMDSVSSDLVSSAALARSEAIARGTRIVTCHSSNPYASEATLACGGEWKDGWVVFSDENSNGGFDNGTDILIRRRGSASGISITTGNNYVNRFTYESVGRPTQNDTFTLSDELGGGVGDTTVVFSSSGRIRVTKS